MEIPPADYNPKESRQGVGPTVAIVIIVLLLAIGGVYFLITEEMERRDTPSSEQASL